MKNLIFTTLIITLVVLNTGCTQKPSAEQISQDWHPAINKQLEELDKNNVLTFGKIDKEDGRYCYVSYEGFFRDETVLSHARKTLENIQTEINLLLKNEFLQTASEFAKKRKATSLEQLSKDENAYLQKKSELECLKTLAERQAQKYAKRLVDRRFVVN